MAAREYLILIAGMALVTYLPRWLPLLCLSQRSIPAWLADWLDLIPVAILSALLAPALFASAEPRQLELLRPESVVALPTLLIALKTRSLGGTVVAGMFLFWLAGVVW